MAESFKWTKTATPGTLRAYARDGESLWIDADRRGWILRHGQTIWESDTAGKVSRIEAEAARLGIKP